MLILFTDTDTDMTPEIAQEYGYKLISMPYIINDETIYPYVDFKHFDEKSFYDMLRNGVVPKTCAISPAQYMEYFEPYFKEGHDILYVHFSAAMSGTFNALNIAIKELKEKYPDRTLYTLDTKGITICSYNIVCEVGEMYKKGATVDEILAWGEKEVDKFAIYFYADDLKFFQKSGRISNFSSIMGTIFGIHPIIYIGTDGQMTSISKGKGRKGTLNKIVSYVLDLQDDIKDHKVIIGHTDAIEIATMLGDMLKEKLGDDLDIEYVVVNPTAGSHCGPNGVGVCFHAIHR